MPEHSEGWLDYSSEKKQMEQLVQTLRVNEEGMARKFLKEEVFQEDGETRISRKTIHRIGRALLAEEYPVQFQKLKDKCTEQARRVCMAYILKNAKDLVDGPHSEAFWKSFKEQVKANRKALSFTANQIFDGENIDTACQRLDTVTHKVIVESCYGFWPDLCEYDPNLDAYYCQMIDAAYDNYAKVWIVLGAEPGFNEIKAPPPTWKEYKEERWGIKDNRKK